MRRCNQLFWHPKFKIASHTRQTPLHPITDVSVRVGPPHPHLHVLHRAFTRHLVSHFVSTDTSMLIDHTNPRGTFTHNKVRPTSHHHNRCWESQLGSNNPSRRFKYANTLPYCVRQKENFHTNGRFVLLLLNTKSGCGCGPCVRTIHAHQRTIPWLALLPVQNFWDRYVACYITCRSVQTPKLP